MLVYACVDTSETLLYCWMNCTNGRSGGAPAHAAAFVAALQRHTVREKSREINFVSVDQSDRLKLLMVSLISLMVWNGLMEWFDKIASTPAHFGTELNRWCRSVYLKW